MSQTLFPTTVIGSLPRPEWIRELILDRKDGKIPEDEVDRLLDPAVESVITMQERAGLDEITDGEWRRESDVKVFAERTHGFQLDITKSAELTYPAIVAPIEYYRQIVADEVKFTRARTKRRLKATLPAPYILGRRMWNAECSQAAYPTREKFMAAIVPILRQEIAAIREAGADIVQLDEPWLVTLIDPGFCEREGLPERITDVQYEIDLCVDLLNQTVEGIDSVHTGMHLCHGHFNYSHGSEGPYDIIMAGLNKVKVDIISMEFATPVAGGLDALAKFPKNVRLGLGCIDQCDHQVETPEQVVQRVEAAMKYVEKERISLHPDCGFSPSVQNPMDLDEAYHKLKSMSQAAKMLRAKYG